MPQILLILGKKAQGLTDEQLADLDVRITRVIEETFEIKNDVAFTCIEARLTRGEADMQFNVGFSAGEDKYGKGEIFNPPMEKKKLLVERIGEVFNTFLADYELLLTGSVWCLPYDGSTFKMIEMIEANG